MIKRYGTNLVPLSYNFKSWEKISLFYFPLWGIWGVTLGTITLSFYLSDFNFDFFTCLFSLIIFDKLRKNNIFYLLYY